MEKQYKNCQSCGMPMKKDPKGGGTDSDGTINTKYCSYCYQEGDFMNPDIDSASKMQSFAKEKLKEMGYPGFVAGFFVRGIPKLERWRGGW